MTPFLAAHHVMLEGPRPKRPEQAGRSSSRRRGHRSDLLRQSQLTMVGPPCGPPSCLLRSVGVVRLPPMRGGGMKSGIPLGQGALGLLLPSFLRSLGMGWEEQSRSLAEAAGVLLIN